MHQKTGPGGDAVALVVLLPRSHGALPHVHIHHQPCPGLQRHHRKRAGVGKQVKHGQPTVLHRLLRLVRQHMVTHPAAAFGHVEEQAVVLSLEQVHPELRALLHHHVGFRHAACHQPGVGLAFKPALVHPVERLAGRYLLPPRGQCGPHGGQFRVGGGLEAGEQKNGRKSIQRPVFTARVQTPTAVKNALGIGGQGHRGDGVEHCLHGGWVVQKTGFLKCQSGLAWLGARLSNWARLSASTARWRS